MSDVEAIFIESLCIWEVYFPWPFIHWALLCMSLTLTCEQLETEQCSRFNLIQFVRTHTQSAFNRLYAGFFYLFLSFKCRL